MSDDYYAYYVYLDAEFEKAPCIIFGDTNNPILLCFLSSYKSLHVGASSNHGKVFIHVYSFRFCQIPFCRLDFFINPTISSGTASAI